MTKYLVVYHAPPAFTEKMMGMNKDEQMAEMGRWQTWSEGIGKSLLDLGTPLFGGMNVMRSGNHNSDRQVTGYSMIEADSMDAAMKLMGGHPHLAQDDSCEIEIHEAAPLPGM